MNEGMTTLYSALFLALIMSCTALCFDHRSQSPRHTVNQLIENRTNFCGPFDEVCWSELKSQAITAHMGEDVHQKPVTQPNGVIVRPEHMNFEENITLYLPDRSASVSDFI